MVVSHSRRLAEAAVALATTTVPSAARPVIAVAAGITGRDGTGAYGTDAAAVAEAIGTADSPDGVLVLMDIGSSVLSAQLAVEFLDEDLAARVGLCSAPVVEGLIAAVVTASGGAPLGAVAAEARAGLRAKEELIGDTGPAGAPPGSTGSPLPTAGTAPTAPTIATLEVALTSPAGWHLRPAARLAGLVQEYDAEVSIADPARGSGPVDAASLTDLLLLDAANGDRLRVTATGPRAGDAIGAIARLAATGFGDLAP
ncbi:HPr family phosphocarrier protein [Raineyella sp. LH-20]|uniref:PTS sugar transporter subunit IIA domain-containing protein n=1 Tax=Raineyella sp. LH-20 TaxID=3081204 RepID=UPI0029545FA9|nr:HPr family phosphocarrier protein [Raineyella sp. LH-20]WOP19344.1 HPr family phosphocarrier protein [Raineyella sp. LH-20]